jgi:hypothetical protein
MCIRHELSTAVHTSAPLATMWVSLSLIMAVDTAAFLTENVPPNPQHVAASCRSTSSSPSTPAQQAQRGVAHAHHPGGVACGVVDDPMWEPRAHVLNAEVVRYKGREFVHPRSQGLDLFGEFLVMHELGQPFVVVDHHRRAGTRRGDNRLGIGEHLHEPPHQWHCLETVAGVRMELSATGLLDGKVDLDPESLEDPHDRPARFGEQGVVEAGDEERDAHALVLTAASL